ncbi:hypothetical protein E4U21_004006 [Claviceps maximensis]|nr:hypothetical protein E4U21_004006 [Claviceps maximensis]
MLSSLLLLLLPVWTGNLVSAAPAKAVVAAKPAAACTITDFAQIAQQKNKCTTITLKNIQVPAGKTLDLDNLNDHTHIIFAGKTTFGFKAWQGPLISVSGKNIFVEGAPGNIIDGGGKRWWDGKGGNGGIVKPKFFNAHNLIDSQIKGLSVLNTPAWAFSISASNNLGVYGVNIDDSAGDTQGGHNTDGFDVGTSSNIIISGCSVRNQDDCLAINSGSNITFVNGYCSGGHGLSIGSVGGRSQNTVQNVHISNSKVTKSANGIRVKTIAGAQGSVADVTFDNIALSDISQYGIVIQQDYKNGAPTGKPTKGVPITGLTVNRVTGNVLKQGTNSYVLCASCSDWTWTNNKVVDGGKFKVNAAVPAGVVL